MKNYKNRGLILSFTIMVIVFSTFSFHDVMAADDAETICKQKLVNTIFSWDDSKREVSADQSSITLYVKSHDSKQYDFDITVNYAIENGTDKLELSNQKTGTEIVIPTKYDGSKNVVMNITATLVSNLEVTENGNKYDCSRKFVLEASYRFEDNTVEAVDNPSINGICARYKSGQLSKVDLQLDSKFSALNGDGSLSYSKVSSVNANGTSGATLLDNLFPYCAKAKVDSVYSDKQVLNQLYNAASIVINRGKFQETALPNSESEGFVKLDPKNKISLTCDAFANAAKGTLSRYSNIRKFYSTSSDKESMEFHYTPNTSKKADVCSMECVEQVTVSYGPPVAVKAGLCFEYEVEIRSKVTCTSKILTEPPKIEDYKVCTPTAYCNNSGSYYFDQAGPNEDFESCITSCDGGKYSQSCINQCYNKVYGKKNRNSNRKKISLALSESSIQKLANSSNPSWCTVYDYENNKNPDTIDEASQVANTYRGGVYGGYYYYDSDSKINWQEYNSTYTSDKLKLADGTVIKAYPGCYWNGYGRYYFLNSSKGIRTVLNDKHIRVNYNDGGDYLHKWLYYPSNGFKSSAICNDHCEWRSSCGDGYLNEVSPTGTSSAYNAYYKDLDTYNTKLEACSAKAKCSETDAKYTMTVNNTTGEIKTCEVGTDNYDKKGNGTCKSWTESSDKKTEITIDSKNNVITKEVSGVCANKKTPNNDDYKTVISFPGSYVNNKNGTVKFTVPESEKDFYTYKNGEYCVPLNAKNVNVNWWIWDQVNKRSEETKKDVKTTQKTDTAGVTYNHYDGIYNILARLEKFGYLDWNVDVSCFYAVSNNSNPDVPDKSDKGDGSSTTTDTSFPENIDTKAAALDDLFPAKDTSDNATGTSNTKEVEQSTKVSKLNYTSKKNSVIKLADSSTSANRTVGYNWSCDATNLGIKNYPIAPTSLITKIQSQGDKVYADDTEKDFHIRLTKANIRNIRSNYKDKKYNNYGTGKYNNNQNDIVFYKSKFLSNTNYVSSFSGPSDKLCNNMKNGKCDFSFVVQSDSCVKLNEWLLEK